MRTAKILSQYYYFFPRLGQVIYNHRNTLCPSSLPPSQNFCVQRLLMGDEGPQPEIFSKMEPDLIQNKHLTFSNCPVSNGLCRKQRIATVNKLTTEKAINIQMSYKTYKNNLANQYRIQHTHKLS